MHANVVKTTAELSVIKLAVERAMASRANDGDMLKQGGLKLLHVHSIELGRLIGWLECWLKMQCRIDACSARIQSPDGTHQLRWHQDCWPMGIVMEDRDIGTYDRELGPSRSLGAIAWVPLDTIDGTRPTLEVALPVSPHPHYRDERNFLVAHDGLDIRDPMIVADTEPGEVILFSPFAPHRTYLPEGATNTRLSLDLRFWPWPSGG